MSADLNGAHSLVVSNETRGQAIKRRRMALGYSEASFHKATGIDRGAIHRAEAGTASDRTYDRIELWLDREDEKNESVPSSEAGMIELALTIEPGARAVVRIPDTASVEVAEMWRRQLVELVREIRAEVRTPEAE